MHGLSELCFFYIDVKECATDPSCYDKFLQKNPTCELTIPDPMINKMQKTYIGPVDTGAWLLKSGSTVTSCSTGLGTNPLDDYLANTSKNNSDWLKPTTPSKEAPVNGVSFKHIDTKLSAWIRFPEGMKSETYLTQSKKMFTPPSLLKDNQSWLMPKPQTTHWLSGSEGLKEKSNVVLNFNDSTCNSQWLMKSEQTVKF